MPMAGGITKIERSLYMRPMVCKCVDKALAAGFGSGLKDRHHRPRVAVTTENAKAWVTDLACRKPEELGLNRFDFSPANPAPAS